MNETSIDLIYWCTCRDCNMEKIIVENFIWIMTINRFLRGAAQYRLV